MERDNEYSGQEGEDAAPQRLVDALPFTDAALRHAHAVETRMLSVLKRKLDELEPRPEPGRVASDDAPVPAGDAVAPERDPGAHFAALLERSLEQREEAAERELLSRVVRQLCCDEARIIAALSDGQAVAACQVAAASRIALSGVPVLRHASRVGVEAGVMLRDMVPAYIAHLLALGVIETAPEQRAQAQAFDLLMSDESVREAHRDIEQQLKLQPRVSRFSLQLSALGRRLWDRAQAAL